MNQETPRVRQLRVIVEASDWENALAFYRDTLGLTEQASFEGEGEARVAILHAGSATLELSNPAQMRMIDHVETENWTGARIRLAFEVDDTDAVVGELVDGGARLVSPARETPWRSRNARLEAPADLELTVFQELETLEERSSRPGFTRD